MNVSYDLDKYMGSFNFRITIDKVAQSLSKVISVNGVATESDMVEYMLGPEPFVRKIPGRGKFTEVEIVRIYAGYDSLYNWRMMIEEGIDDLRTVKIEILAPDLKTTVLQMVLHNCWPHRWQLPNLDASASSPATETITLACERVTQSVSKPMSPTSSSAVLSGAGGIKLPSTDTFTAPTGGTEEQNFNNDFWGKASKAPKPEKNFNDAFWSGVKRLTAAPEQDFDDSFWNMPSKYHEFAAKQAEALALASQLGEGPLDPNEEKWDPPKAVDDPTAGKNGGDGKGPLKGRGFQAEADYGKPGDGPIGGRGDQTEADYGDAGPGSIDPNTETWDAPEAVDDPTAAKNGGDGKGPKGGRGFQAEADYGKPGDGPIGGRGDQTEADYGESDGIQDPSSRGFGESRAADDPTAAKNGGDGTGPIDPSSKEFGGSAAADDPTAAKNGGDGAGPLGGRGAQAEADYGSPGSGPIGGRGAQEAVDGGAGSGPIDQVREDFGGSAAADDPTAAKNGGDGSGPIGGRGAAAEADYGSPGDGPKGGRGYMDGGE